MQLKTGDCVVHSAHGIGHIVNLVEKQFQGQQSRLYYEVNTPKSTVWVPVEAPRIPSIRLLTDKSDLARYRGLLKSRPSALTDDYRKRHVELAERLRQGSFQIICEVVRDLTARGWNKPLSSGDATWLRRAREDLEQEWAASEGVAVSEAAREIDSLLLESRRQYIS